MKRLGGGVINLGPAEGSSISKGESLADTVRVVAVYADAHFGGIAVRPAAEYRIGRKTVVASANKLCDLLERLVYNSNS
jgi:aspartate carbamoyltransferase catalytic subunit